MPINIISRGTFARSNTSRFSSVDRQVKGPAPDARPAGGGGSSSGGTVRSVALTVPSALLAVTGSPVTQAGTLALSLPARAANLVFAGPATGAVAAPAFRALVADDLPGGIGGREMLTANRTYYVRTDGNDSNDGLANTAGGAFLTIQHAVNVVAALDLAGYTATVAIADGTYAEAVTLAAPVGSGIVDIVGNTSTPANVLINATGSCFSGLATAAGTAQWRIRGVKVQATAQGFLAASGCSLELSNIDFGACSSFHMFATLGGRILVVTNYAITGGGTGHLFAQQLGSIQVNNSLTITLTGTPNFSSAFVSSLNVSTIRIRSATFSGSATGKRFDVSLNGVIDVGGATPNTYLPGNSNGTAATGGQCA